MHLLHLLSLATLQLALPAWGDNAVTSSNTGIHGRRDVVAVTEGASPCTDGFNKPSYQLSGFQFNKTTIEAGDRGMTRFQLNDVANDGSLPCRTPYLQDPDQPVWIECDRNKTDPVVPKTSFKYTASSSELEINQMWVCEVENKTHPLLYFSSAKIDLSEFIDCVDDPTQTRCTVADDAVSAFDGDYVTPVWNSGEVEEIPPSQEEAIGMPWNESPCIGSSFSYPNWDVQDFAYDEGDGTASFSLYNHGSKETVTCTAQGSEWSNCGDSSTTVLFAEETAELSVNQTWFCDGDKNWSGNVTFWAEGSAVVDTESTESTYIKGSLLEPIKMTPNVAPEGVNYKGCQETSISPEWTVTSWEWWENFRNGYNAGNLTVTFYNPSVGFNMTCEGNGDELARDNRYGYERWWGCRLQGGPFSSYEITSRIKLNPITHIFSINQTWYCNGNEDKLPTKFNAEGQVDVTNNLDCTWKNETAANNSFKLCRYTETPLVIEGTKVEQTELAPDEFFELSPTGYSCTIASVLATQWRGMWSTDTVYAKPSTSADSMTTNVYFPLQFMAMAGFRSVNYNNVSITPFLPSSDPGNWLDCEDYRGPNSDSSFVWAKHSLECKWQLDLATGYFAINHTWYCDDKDPENPIVFHAYGSRYYDFSCYVYRNDDQFQCNPTGLNPPPVLPTHLEWKSIPAAELQA